jgi:trans-aconitate 2-methyltransferase
MPRDESSPWNPAWDVAQYTKFADHRLRPALELFSRIQVDDPLVIHDVGCGTGDITRLMAERWPHAEVVGSDSSREMLAKASQMPSRVRWQQADVRHWRPDQPHDIIYSNAVLHWVGGHEDLLPRLVSFLAPGGVLAIQMPLSWDEPSHRSILDVLEQLDLGTDALRRRYRTSPVAAPEWYLDLLYPLVDTVDVWTTRYFQLLRGDDPVVEWVRGTGLRPVIDELTPSELTLFMTTYRALMQEHYPKLTADLTVFPFPRLFILATR